MGSTRDSRTVSERRTDLDLYVTRTFDAPVHIVYAAWTKAEHFMRWWGPKSSPVPLIACEMDVRTGGGYRVAFGHNPETAMSFFGKYLEVVPNRRLVWTNEESPDAAITTVTFEARDDKTLLVMHERYPNKEALDQLFIGSEDSGMEDATAEQFSQLDVLLPTLIAEAKA